MRPKCIKALSRRGLARVHLGEYTTAQSDILNALEFLPENEVAEKERIKIILMKAKKGLTEQNKALEKRKSSMKKAFAAKEGGIGDSRVKPDPKPKKVKPFNRTPQYTMLVMAAGVIASILVLFFFFFK